MPAQPKSWYAIKNAANGNPARITIEDEIGGWGVTAKNFRSDFGRIGKDEAIAVHIKSGGGSCFEGSEIANIIAGHAGEVTVTLGSICASIATVIACAGAKVIAAKNTLFMIHEPTVYAGGDAKELRKMAGILDKIKGGIVAAYVKKTGATTEEMSDAMAAETWYTAEEAMAAGFVDEISEDDADDDVIENVDLRHYANSATLFERLQMQNAGETAEHAGNGGRLTLAAIRNSATPPNKPAIAPKNSPTPHTMTPEEIAAQKALNDKAVADGIKAAVTAQKNRRTEVLAMVAQEKNRTHCDFSAEAETFLDSEKPAHEFAAVIFASSKKPAEIVGSGIELIEPLDAHRGTAGFHFVNSEGFRAVHGRPLARNTTLSLTVPAGFGARNATQTTTSPNTLTNPEYTPGITPLGVRVLRIKELIMPGATNAMSIVYRRESAFANAAAIVAETGTLPNVVVTVSEVTANVTDLGGYIEMSENLMADLPAVASLINFRLPYMVERATEDALLNSSSGLVGLLQTSGIQTQAKGADTNVDAIHKAITIARFVPNATQANAQGGYEPDAIVMNPVDWQLIRLAKDSNGQYYAGGPFTGAYGNGAFSNVFSVWGKMVVVTPAITAGTALVGAFKECSQYFQRQGVTIEMTNSNGTNFVNRIVTLRAAERLALTVPQPNGFAQVTGIA